MDYVDDFEQDSGMESSPLYGNSSKDDTPERKPSADELDLPKEEKGPGIETITPKEGLEKPPEPSREIPVQEKPIKTMENSVARFDEENCDDEPDETLAERLWGLTEMFPDSVTNVTSLVVSTTWSGIKNVYSFSRTAAWIVATSSVILFAPILFEVERAKVDEMQKSQQKQFLLGPSAAMLGAGSAPPPIPR